MEKKTKEHRVLLIDDDQEILKTCEELLCQNGFQVTPCSDSTQVMSLLKGAPFDVAVLDIRMPGMEGTDLLPLIKKVCPDLAVIIASAYCEDSDRGYYHELGACEAISKPFSPEVLLDAVYRAADQKERIPLTLTSFSLREARDLVYRKVILSALRKTNWNQVKAADLLGVSRYCLMRWIRKLGIAY